MSSFFTTIFQSLLVVLTLSVDVFVTVFAYGTNKTKIPFISNLIINLICTGVLGFSLFCGDLLELIIPNNLIKIICFFILFLIGISKLIKSLFDYLIRKDHKFIKKVEFSFIKTKFFANFSQKFFSKNSKILLPGQAATLALAISLDGLAVGLSLGMTDVNNFQIIIFSLIIGMIITLVGYKFGSRIAEKVKFNLSWLSGLLLIIMAFAKL